VKTQKLSTGFSLLEFLELHLFLINWFFSPSPSDSFLLEMDYWKNLLSFQLISHLEKTKDYLVYLYFLRNLT